MPVYKVDINYVVQTDDVDKMLAKTQYTMHRALVAAFYLTGGRPSEVLGIRTSDINIADDSVVINIETKKLGKTTGFIIRSRLLEFSKDAPYMNVLLEQRDKLLKMSGNEGTRLFPICRRTCSQTIEKLSEGRFCPYNFRHSRLTKLANEECTLGELMSWKGARDTRSVSPYLAGKKIGRRLNIT